MSEEELRERIEGKGESEQGKGTERKRDPELIFVKQDHTRNRSFSVSSSIPDTEQPEGVQRTLSKRMRLNKERESI